MDELKLKKFNSFSSYGDFDGNYKGFHVETMPIPHIKRVNATVWKDGKKILDQDYATIAIAEEQIQNYIDNHLIQKKP